MSVNVSQKRGAVEGIEVIRASEDDVVEITPIGGGSEVGRSCILLSYKGKKVLLDCGVHPAYTGIESLPYFDLIEMSDIDVLLITHFHLDHAAALPYIINKTEFNGKVYCTYPTKAIIKILLPDFIRRTNVATDESLYNEDDLNKSMETIKAIDFHQEVEVNGIKFCCYSAGHVLGAAMFMIEIADVKILYTGDYSREEDRHLMSAEIPSSPPDILICEATHGVQTSESREIREQRLTQAVHGIIRKNGKCLMPVFALGRAQELLLILDEYWESHKAELQDVPIYYVSKMAKQSMKVYHTFINMMNDRIRNTNVRHGNPFKFKHITYLDDIKTFKETGPCVMMASPGMLQSGLSRQLFEQWCPDRRNGVVLPGFCVEGTLAKEIMSEPREIKSMEGRTLPLKCSVTSVSFSAHADFPQTSQFIDSMMPRDVVLVHGESKEMERLKTELVRKYRNNNDNNNDNMVTSLINVHTPKNSDTIRLTFKGSKQAKVVGTLAQAEPSNHRVMSGLIVKKDFKYQIMSSSDLPIYTTLKTSTVEQTVTVPYTRSLSLLCTCLNEVFGPIETEISKDSKDTTSVVLPGRAALLTYRSSSSSTGTPSSVTVMWYSSPVNDVISDALIALLMQIEASPSQFETLANAIDSKNNNSNVYTDKAVLLLKDLLEAQFGEVFDSAVAPISSLPSFIKQESEVVKKEVSHMIDSPIVKQDSLMRLESSSNVDSVIDGSSHSKRVLAVTLDGVKASLVLYVNAINNSYNWNDVSIRCGDQALRRRLDEILRQFRNVIFPVFC